MKKNIFYPLLFALLACCTFSCEDNDMGAMSDVIGPSGSGKGGSMARFTIAGDHLYVVDSRTLHVYELADPTTPTKVKEVKLGVNIETIFPYRGKLFIGSMNGMHIYDIEDPQNPLHLSTYSHVTSCDPVVVQDTLAYVTLRTGSECRWGTNQLDIINISDPKAPQLISSYPMENPFGLGIDGNTLFLCEGENGLKVLNVANPYDIKELNHVQHLHAFDVIPNNNNLILTGRDGVFQYNYADPHNLSLNSQLTTSNCE